MNNNSINREVVEKAPPLGCTRDYSNVTKYIIIHIYSQKQHKYT